MQYIEITGGRRLAGELAVCGAKNAVLPILAACLLIREPVVLSNCPQLKDVDNMVAMLRQMGCAVERAQQTILVNAHDAAQWQLPERYMHLLRSSVFLAGPCLARHGQVAFSQPGGCEIGLRPIDLHLKGLSALGAQVEERGGALALRAGQLTGAVVQLDYPSVGATENIMMAAVLAQGQTVIRNAAQEPEVADLAGFLSAMGARVRGAGTAQITVEGVRRLHGGQYRILPDRIVAGTYLCAAAIAGGDVRLRQVTPLHLAPVIEKLRQAGCEIDQGIDDVRLIRRGRLRSPGTIQTQPYPGFPTDMQAQMLALCTLAEGTSVVVENVFENRFKHAGDLARMGARILVRDRVAVVHGAGRLTGCRVTATDLRGGAALALAALGAAGATRIDRVDLIDRGYPCLEADLAALGADARRVTEGTD